MTRVVKIFQIFQKPNISFTATCLNHFPKCAYLKFAEPSCTPLRNKKHKAGCSLPPQDHQGVVPDVEMQDWRTDTDFMERHSS
jgi:hypothetical protein